MKKFYLMMALVLCALTANADDAQQGCKIYFDATGCTENVVQFCIGHDGWTSAYEMQKIANTNLYFYEFTEKWGGYNYFAVIGVGSKWGDGNWSVSNLKNAPFYTAPQYSYRLDAQSYLITHSGKNTINTSWMGGGYAELNKTQKVEVLHDGDNLSGAATLSSHKLSGVKASAPVNGTEIAAAQTATVTCVATVEDGTCFKGWFEGETLVSENATYTYVVTGEKTLIAKFAYDPVTAIESVEAASAAVEYYNLQGVKVANPEKGIFIKKAGNKTTKVIL